MTPRSCIVCGSPGPLQWHHLAGRAYALRLGAWACRGCHSYLHARLAAGGIDLRHPTLTPAVRAWAVTRGVSETFAGALTCVGAAEAAAELRSRARSVGRVLVASQPVCVALSPRPLTGQRHPHPVQDPDADPSRQAEALLELANRAQHVFDDEEEGRRDG
jgi:hypothetical protein